MRQWQKTVICIGLHFETNFKASKTKIKFLIINLVNILNVLPLDFVQVIKKETMTWTKDISHNKHLIYSAKTGKVRGISWCLLQIPGKTLFKPTLQKVTVRGMDISTKSLSLCHLLPLLGCKSQIRTEMVILMWCHILSRRVQNRLSHVVVGGAWEA